MKDKTCLEVIAIFTIALIVGTFSVVTHGWALSILWGWFVVPLFHVPLVTPLQASGVVLIIQFLTYKTGKDENEDKAEVLVKAFVASIIFPLMYVGLGWTVHQIAF